MRKQKGFTLVEVLIVVIIIAILAALVVPRFLSQPEKAVLAEANQMLGAISRAQNVCVDSGSCTAWVALDATGLAKIGMQAPGTTNFTYACSAGGPCTATRNSGDYAACKISVTQAGAWSVASCPAGKTYTCPATGGCSV